MHMAMPFMQDVAVSVKPWEELTIADNFIFQAVMRKKRCCRRFIESVLGIKVKKITYPVLTEKDIKVRRESKGVRLDVYLPQQQGQPRRHQQGAGGFPRLRRGKDAGEQFYEGLGCRCR